MSLKGSGFCVFRSYKLCPWRTPSPSMHLCPRWNSGIWDAEIIKVDQTQRACVVLMLRRLIVCVLLGRFLPQLLCDLYASWKRFVLQRRIWPKYNFKGDAPPSVSSAGRIFAAREAFIFACCVTLGLLLLCTLWRILQFSPGLFCSRMFACVSINIRQVSVRRCRAAGLQQLPFSQHLPVFLSDTRSDCMLELKTASCAGSRQHIWVQTKHWLWCWNKHFGSLIN